MGLIFGMNKNLSQPKDIADRDEIIAELLSCLTWYVENDDTNDSEHNAVYLAGLSRAKDAIAKATGEDID